MDLQAQFITVTEDVDVFTIQRVFSVRQAPVSATIRVTALGMYRLDLNGSRVGDERLAPGFTSYGKTLQVQQYDVTKEVNLQENIVSITVARGWYCGRFGYRGKDKLFGEKAAGLIELVLRYTDGTVQTIGTDLTWTASETYIRHSSIYDGETHDYSTALKLLTPEKIVYNMDALILQDNEPVRVSQRLTAKFVCEKDGVCIYDFKQNLSGVVELTLAENHTGEIMVSHAEVLDGDGNLYTANLRSAKAQDVYIGGKKGVLCPEFTFHGFRYIGIQGVKLPEEQVTALVMHSDLHPTGTITTSNERFNRLLENIRWSQRGNFVDIPSDCPQRDERLGWTGDANVFCRTAAYNYDVSKFFKKWLRDVRNDQKQNGELSVVVPDVLGEYNTAALWADSITMIPWTLYEMYGDESFLKDNFVAMQKYLAAVEKSTEKGLITHGFQYGDWLGLDKEEGMPELGPGSTDSYFVANVFWSESLRIARDTATLLANKSAEKQYAEKYEQLITAIRAEYFSPNGRMACETQTAFVLALHFGIAPNCARAGIAARLNDNVVKHGYHLTTGFAGTPYLLFALSDNGYHDTAAKVLMNRSYPGWLYEVDLGATTVWERWNGIYPDKTFYSPAMNSFNHYAYGSVAEFVYRRIVGIDCSAPGFKKVKIAPTPTQGLLHVRGEYETQFGKIVAGYDFADGNITIFAEIPEGIEAQVYLPDEEKPAYSGYGVFSAVNSCPNLECDAFDENTKLKDILDNPQALIAFNAVSGNLFAGERMKSMRDVPLIQLAKYMGEGGKERIHDMLEAANKIYQEATKNV